MCKLQLLLHKLLMKAMAERYEELRNVEVCHLHVEGETPYANPELKDSFHVNSFFIGKNVTAYINSWKWIVYASFFK